MLQKSIHILKGLQYKTGLFAASSMNVKTGYNLSWIRDNIYESLGFEALKDYKSVKKTFHALLDILLKHEYKIDWAIKEKPKHRHQYIHARYNPITMEEVWEEWGNKQNDAVGALLFKIGDLELKGIKIIRNENDLRIMQKVVYYLESIEYWKDRDNGMWEENEEIHASSVGACVAGLKKISRAVDIDIPEELIKKGEDSLADILPRESETKETDLALLSLIYPYNIAAKSQREIILKSVEEKLLRERGVIRYKRDRYYCNEFGEAQWTMGLCWLAIIYKKLNNPEKYAHYFRMAVNSINRKGELPELYFAGSDKHNENSPLGWAQSLFVVAQAEE